MSDNLLKYKGYLAKLEMSSEDECIFGKIEFINDLITFEGETVKEAKQNFERAVDDYLRFCEEQGVAADKPCSGSFNIRVSSELHKHMSIKALEKGVSLNSYINTILERYHEVQAIHRHNPITVVHYKSTEPLSVEAELEYGVNSMSSNFHINEILQ